MQEFFPNSNFLSPNGARTLEQITWSTYVTSVPEPSTLVLGLFSFALFGFYKTRVLWAA
jgi:hypothetical protein